MKRFTEREKEVLKLIAKGLNKKKIAERLTLSTGTIQTHFNNIYSKVHFSNYEVTKVKIALWYIKQLLDEHIFAGLEPNKRQLKNLREVFKEL